MELTFLLDENVPGRVWRAIQRHNAVEEDTLDVVRAGQADDLPFSCDDPTILLWAERHGRILIREDKSTMPAHLEAHLGRGNHCPGVFMVHPSTRIPELVEFLVLAAHASKPDEWLDRIQYIP